ncbi:MAG TPA: hypothetical protein VMC80_01730 [Patescibacteria group bacterium]|nr:hypothetical protein [Patescibacteria group bacterium]
MNKNMDFKKILVSFLTIAVLLAATVANVSAYTPIPSPAGITVAGFGTITDVKINGVSLTSANEISANAGDTVSVEVHFTALANASNVRARATISGETTDSVATSNFFDVEAGRQYVETFSVKVPSDLASDQVSESLPLDVRVWNSDFNAETGAGLTLRVQSPSYNAAIESVNVDSTIKAGQTFPVQVVLKNTGYNDLSGVSVTASISTLGIQKTLFFGDLFNVVTSTTDNPNTVSGTMYLTMPNNVKTGTYALDIISSNSNSQATSTQTVQLNVQNDYPQTVLQTATGLLIVNPTTSLQVFKVVLPDNTAGQLVTVQAGASQTVDVKANTADYTVSVQDLNGNVLGTFKFQPTQGQTGLTQSPIVVLTVILGIVFLVLLVVLVVLLSRKPQKSQELGESYY